MEELMESNEEIDKLNNKLERRMKILKEMDTDDSRFLYRICKAYKKYNDEMYKLKKTINIEINDKKTNITNGIINLNDIECEKYFNTKIKINMKRMVESIISIDEEEFYKKKNICKNIIYKKKESSLFQNKNKKIDIVELIKSLDENEIKNVKIIARNISDENIFKYCELTKALEIINNSDTKVRNKIIYEYIYEYLNKDFISNQYCDFINNKKLSI